MAELTTWGGRPKARTLAAIKARDHACHLCGHPVDKDLDPHRHPLGPTCDHLTPRSMGGDPYDLGNCALAHRICNTTRGVSPITPELRKLCREMVEQAQTPHSVVITEW